MVANGLNKGSGALDDRAVRYMSSTQANYYPPSPGAAPADEGDLILGGPGRLQQVVFFGVTEMPNPENFGDTSVYVKVGESAPAFLTRMTHAKYVELFVTEFPGESVATDGAVVTQFANCTALSPDLFIVALLVPRNDLAGFCVYVGLCSLTTGIIAERIVSGETLDSGDPDTIIWSGALANYTDWLPTERDFRAPWPRGILYGEVDEITGGNLAKSNVASDRQTYVLDPGNEVLPQKAPNSAVFPLAPFVNAETVSTSFSSGQQEVGLSFPMSDWDTLGLGGQNIYGYIENEFGDLAPTPIAQIYENPAIASNTFSGGLFGQLILSPAFGTNAWQSGPFSLFTLAQVKAVAG